LEPAPTKLCSMPTDEPSISPSKMNTISPVAPNKDYDSSIPTSLRSSELSLKLHEPPVEKRKTDISSSTPTFTPTHISEPPSTAPTIPVMLISVHSAPPTSSPSERNIKSESIVISQSNVLPPSSRQPTMDSFVNSHSFDYDFGASRRTSYRAIKRGKIKRDGN